MKNLKQAQIQGGLFGLGALYLALYAAALALAPTVRERSWQIHISWYSGLIWLGWFVIFLLIFRFSARRIPGIDPYLLPVAALLSGWGVLAIWRLYPSFGLRQLAWLLVAACVFIGGLYLPHDLGILRRYKYVWLTSGLLFTGLTFVIGTNPSGGFARLWLGCCGVYLQPSEPLKMLIVVYLAAYLADHPAIIVTHLPFKNFPLLPFLLPTLLVMSLATILLLGQRDLGTASLLIVIYVAVVYIASGRKRVLLVGAVGVVLAAIAGNLLFDMVKLRIGAWINPWIDPSGRSYQIVQSLIAIANGGLFGRGPGLGSPGLVPLPHSDFIFSAITEETGLVGALSIIVLLGILVERGLVAALNAHDPFRRYLAVGLTVYLAAQSILIIGGNVRLLPLTGVTLPFLSYGGSSLITVFFALSILIKIGARADLRPTPLTYPRPYMELGGVLFGSLLALAVTVGWWAVYRAPVLLDRTDNARRALADRYVLRGKVVDRHNLPIIESSGNPGEMTRVIRYPPLSNILGYTHPVYGQAGLEDSLDSILRGQQGYPALIGWWNHLLYGAPPPGLDVRVSLDLDLQQKADDLLGDYVGGLALVNAQTGEILALASHPSFDANRLDEDWVNLVNDPRSPLLNRAVQGQYPVGAALGPLLMARVLAEGDLPSLPEDLSYVSDTGVESCALQPSTRSWGQAINGGCPGAVAEFGRYLGKQKLRQIIKDLGLFDAPKIELPPYLLQQSPEITDPADAALGQGLAVSPLQMALAAAGLSANGVRPAAVLLSAINSPETGWTPVTPSGEKQTVFPESAALQTSELLGQGTHPIWYSVASVQVDNPSSSSYLTFTWFLAGTKPESTTPSLALALLLEEGNPLKALEIGQKLLLEGTSGE